MPDSLFQAYQACNFIKKEILAQMFSCEFCEIFKNTFFTEHLRTTASENVKSKNSFVRGENRRRCRMDGLFSIRKIALKDGLRMMILLLLFTLSCFTSDTSRISFFLQ